MKKFIVSKLLNLFFSAPEFSLQLIDPMLTTDFTHRASALDNQFVYIMDEIEEAKILGELSRDHEF